MPLYRYNSNSTIREITFKNTEGGQHYAYLHAAENTPADMLDDIMCKAAERGWRIAPSNIGGKPTLQIAGFRKEEDIANWLQTREWTSGQPQIEPDIIKEINFSDKLKKRSLAASGVAYVAGDLSFMKYGYSGGDWMNTAAGVMYGAGTASLLGFGRKDQSDLQIREITKKLNSYVRENGHDISPSASIDSILNDKDKGTLKTADDFFRRYPSEMMSLCFAAAGTLIMTTAYKHHIKTPMALHEAENTAKEVIERWQAKPTKYAHNLAQPDLNKTVLEKVKKSHKLEGFLDVGLGSLTTISGLFAMSVKEKKQDPDAPQKEGFEAVWEKIKQKPLAIAGYGYMVSTLCHAFSTATAMKYADNERRKSVPWRAVFVASNIVAELLLSISSKGHGEGVKSDGTVDTTVISLAAEMIVKQPAKMQDGLIDYVCGFLGRPDVLALKNDDARRLITQEVELMRNNPWAHAAHRAANAAPTAVVTSDKTSPAWQTKISLRPDTQNQASL